MKRATHLTDVFPRGSALIVEDKIPQKPCRTNKLLAAYDVDENGLTVLKPTHEYQVRRAFDGKSYEISNLMYGALPEQLIQFDMDEPMVKAEKITSACVRRFGTLREQKENYIKSLKSEEV